MFKPSHACMSSRNTRPRSQSHACRVKRWSTLGRSSRNHLRHQQRGPSPQLDINSKYHTDALFRFPSPPQCHHRTIRHHHRGNDNFSQLSPKLVDGHAELNTQLFAEQVGQRAIVAQVQPLAHSRVLLLVLPVTHNDVVIALGTRLGRRQPDLLVGWLLVDDVGANLGPKANVEDAGLVGAGWSAGTERGDIGGWGGGTNAILNVEVLGLLLEPLEL